MRTGTLLRFAAVVSLAVLSASPSSAGRLASDLRTTARGSDRSLVRVVVQASPGGRGRVAALARRSGGRPLRVFSALETVVAEVPAESLSSLAAAPAVRLVAPDRSISACLDTASRTVGATQARAATGLDGSGVGVAVLDTGVSLTRDLHARVVGWADLVNRRPQPYDDSGHGTHVAGILAGDGSAAASFGRDLRGVAPGASLVAVKVLDRRSQGRLSTVLAGLDWVLANRARFNIRIVNLALGLPVRESYQEDPLCQAVETVTRAGILVVVAAGNQGRTDPEDPASPPRYGSISSPGNSPYALTVGATRGTGTPEAWDDEVASYSSRGPTLHDLVVKPDLVAPGNRILSPLALGRPAVLEEVPDAVVRVGGARYLELSGTSMATPMVAGAAALMLQAEPALSVDTLKLRLMASAIRQWNPMLPYTPYARGSGLLHVPGALTSVLVATAPVLSPTVEAGQLPGDIQITPYPFPTELMIWGDKSPFGDPDDPLVWELLRSWRAAPHRLPLWPLLPQSAGVRPPD